jgi:hypothetical protein
MRFPARSASAVALCVAALVAAPAGLAQPTGAQLVAQSASFGSAADQQGTLHFLYLAGGPGPSPQLHAEGRHIEAKQYDYEGAEAYDVAGKSQSTGHALNGVSPNTPRGAGLDAARLELTGVAAEYRFHLFSSDGLPASGRVDHGSQRALQQPEFTLDGIEDKSNQGDGSLLAPLSGLGSGKEDGAWSRPVAPTPHVLTQAKAGALRLTGTFTIEVVGFDFRLTGAGAPADLHSGVAYTPLAPGRVDSHARTFHESFLRITVTDGTLQVAAPGGVLQWSGPAANTVADGITMQDATGSIQLADGQQQSLTGASYRLDGRYDLKANPAEQGLQLAVTGLDEQGQPLVPQSTAVRQVASPIYWAVVAAVAGSAAVTAFVVLLLHRRPTMADVESALEAGHFRRAARDAARLLRSRPGFEDAVISRAIALSKLGRNQRVVREIRAHFATREPSDGVLHYVLGLALRETGAAADAQAAWREALRRTPGLLPQVQPLLAAQQASSHASAVAPTVDGTAYA